MKRLVLILGFLFLGFFSNAQSSLPKNVSDSLWGIWNNSLLADTIRLQALQTYTVDGYLRTMPDSAYYLAQLQYDFANLKGVKKQMANAQNTQGVSWFLRSNSANALVCFQASLILWQELNEKKGIANSLVGIGNAYKDLGDYATAIDYYNESLKINEEIENKVGVAVALNNIGIIYKNLGDYTNAIIYYTQSLKIKEELKDKKGTATSLGNLGIIYKNLGDYAKAMACYSKSLAIELETSNKQGMAGSYNSIGNLYREQGDDAQAIMFYKRGLQIYEELGNKIGIATILNNIGIVFQTALDFSKALEHYNRSLAICIEIRDKRGASAALNNIASFYKDQDNFTTAIDYYEQSLKIKEEIKDKSGIIYSLIGIGTCYYELDSMHQAAQYSRMALQLAVEIGEKNLIKEACCNLLDISIKNKQKDAAVYYLSLLKNTVQLGLNQNYFSMSEREREFYFATMEKDFGRYYDFTLVYQDEFRNLTDTAYNLALTNKGLSLKSSTAMRSAVFESKDSALIADYENWISLKRKITDAFSKGTATQEMENEANELEKQLVKNSKIFNDFEKLKNLEWKQVQQALRSNECAIEFINFKNEINDENPIIYAALLILPQSEHPEIIKLCNEDELVKILGTLQGNNFLYVNELYGTKAKLQTALYQKIWQPFVSYLDGVKTIYYSPCGLLHKISFAALSSEQNVFLSDLYNFRQMSSTGNLALNDQVVFDDSENFLLMGGVNFNSDSTEKEVWSYLPGSLNETNAISSYIGKKKYEVNYFTDKNASEETFKKTIVSSTIVHIATHGFFFPDPEQMRAEMKASSISESNEELKFRGQSNYANWSFVTNKNPLMRSGIVLANANDVWHRDPLAEGEDGILTAAEVALLDLRNTKLVVLSACETGLGDIKGSEGVYGLQRAFKMAGVKHIIMSLWKVPDKETAEFMTLFYKNLIKLKDIPVAFQNTQKVMRVKYDPYYWGAFVLIE